jgi:N-acetylglucosamine-6-phosphate deacetylase
MLGLQGVKGTLDAGADADLVVLSDSGTGGGGSESESGSGWRELVVEEVWKFGVRIFERGVDG